MAEPVSKYHLDKINNTNNYNRQMEREEGHDVPVYLGERGEGYKYSPQIHMSSLFLPGYCAKQEAFKNSLKHNQG